MNFLQRIMKRFNKVAPRSSTPPKRNPSFTKKGPGRYHRQGKREYVRGYTKHYTAGHQEPPKNAR